MQLIVVHYHLRPGGVRRVIELSLPAIVQTGNFACVTLLVGEGGADAWVATLTKQLSGTKVRVVVEAACGYWQQCASLGASQVRERVCAVLSQEVRSGDRVWAHNLGLGRNLILADELARLAESDVCVVSHHHDFWFENRWGRWPEMVAAGFPTLAAVGRVIFSPALRSAAINQDDARSVGAAWLPNIVTRTAANAGAVNVDGADRAHQWLRDEWGVTGRYWLVPARLLRRKNLAEAILVLRWLRPDDWLVTTAGVSSADEEFYAQSLAKTVDLGKWPARLSVLAASSPEAPKFDDLMAGAEGILMTSVQEGFGLPYVEALNVGKPLIARHIPRIFVDLAEMGFRFPQVYDEVWISRTLLDWPGEVHRRTALATRWRANLPAEAREAIVYDPTAAGCQAGAVAFSSLTLAGQLAVLSADRTESWTACESFNPALARWRAGTVRADALPPEVANRYGPTAYAERLLKLFTNEPNPSHARDGALTQHQMIAERTRPASLFPLLME